MRRFLDALLFLSLLAWGARVTTELMAQQHRLDRIEYWIGVHHSLIPTSATPAQVRERGNWKA